MFWKKAERESKCSITRQQIIASAGCKVGVSGGGQRMSYWWKVIFAWMKRAVDWAVPGRWVPSSRISWGEATTFLAKESIPLLVSRPVMWISLILLWFSGLVIRRDTASALEDCRMDCKRVRVARPVPQPKSVKWRGFAEAEIWKLARRRGRRRVERWWVSRDWRMLPSVSYVEAQRS